MDRRGLGVGVVVHQACNFLSQQRWVAPKLRKLKGNMLQWFGETLEAYECTHIYTYICNMYWRNQGLLPMDLNLTTNALRTLQRLRSADSSIVVSRGRLFAQGLGKSPAAFPLIFRELLVDANHPEPCGSSIQKNVIEIYVGLAGKSNN